MTQEDKQILLKDLCARLPYGVMCNVFNGKYDEDMKLSPSLLSWDINDIKPYLRPMSSMTEEELKEFVSFTSQSMHRFICESTNTDHWYNAYEEEDWLLAHHFDTRGLIGMGLALEAPEGMYKLKQ